MSERSALTNPATIVVHLPCCRIPTLVLRVPLPSASSYRFDTPLACVEWLLSLCLSGACHGGSVAWTVPSCSDTAGPVGPTGRGKKILAPYHSHRPIPSVP